ncbi:MAG: glycosyltransferase family 9 protein [Acidobacteriota bacterium]|nr:glycosyltransferase family 9 protein [Acidobacteriota bacterium]
MSFNPQNILISSFGQIGDVILSLPAIRAVREKFPRAKITAMVGKSGAAIVESSGFADELMIVDRVKLRDGNKLKSIKEVLKIARDVRRRKFDFVIDLHSLYETNLLGFVSGAKHRLYANRESRSLDFLGNFALRPPREDKTKHLAVRYLDVLAPLGIENVEPFVELRPRASDLKAIENILQENRITDKKLVGLFPGAGHASRRWSLENFARLAELLERSENLQSIVFLGPEEKDLRAEMEERFPPETLIVDNLTLPQFAAALSRLEVLISNDTGAAHIGAIVGTAIVLILDKNAPVNYTPLTENLSVVQTGTLNDISVAEVFEATKKILNAQKSFDNEFSYKIQTK